MGILSPTMSPYSLYGVRGGRGYLLSQFVLLGGTWQWVLCCIDHHQWGLVPIQKNQGTPGETRNTAACLLTVGLSWFGFAGLTAVMISSPFAWFVIQSALCNDNPI